jgi:hypothetical protein
MKTKQSDSNKKQSVVVKDLKAKKNPKGGAAILFPVFAQAKQTADGVIRDSGSTSTK